MTKAIASRVLRRPGLKKHEEEVILRAFLEELRLSRYQISPRESPDFLIRFGSGTDSHDVGCELTSFHHDSDHNGSAERRLFNKWRRFAEQLREDLDVAGQRHLYGAIYFKEHFQCLPEYLEEEEFRKELVAMTIRNKDGESILSFDAAEFPLLAEHVNQINLFKTELGALWWCSHLQTGRVPNPTSSLLDLINSKSAISAGYAWSELKEKWLLIFAESNGLQDVIMFREDPKISSHDNTPNFTRIYTWNCGLNQIHQIFPDFVCLVDESGILPLLDDAFSCRKMDALPAWAPLFVDLPIA